MALTPFRDVNRNKTGPIALAAHSGVARIFEWEAGIHNARRILSVRAETQKNYENFGDKRKI